MKIIKSVAMLAAMTVFSIGMLNAHAAESVFFDDFNSYTAETAFSSVRWTAYDGATVKERSSGDNYVYVSGKNSKITRNYEFSANAIANTAVMYEMDFYQSVTADETRIEVDANIRDVSSLKTTMKIRTYSGKFQYASGSDWIDIQSYSAGQWYNFKIVVNYEANTYDMYIDNTRVINGAATYQNTQGTMAVELHAWNNGNGAFGIDNVRISTLNKRNVIFNETFDSYAAEYNFTGQHAGSKWDNATAIAGNSELTVKELDGKKCLYIAKTNSPGNADLYKNVTSPGALISYEWKFRQDTLADNMRAEILNGSTSSKAVSIKTEDSKFKRWQKDGTWQEISTYETGTWYSFKVILNTAANQVNNKGTYDVYINGVKIDTYECAMSSKSLPSYGIRFITYNALGDFYIDDVSIYSNTIENSSYNVADESTGVDVPYSKAKFHVYLCIGQSNMAGRATVDDYEAAASQNNRAYLFTGMNKWKPSGCAVRNSMTQGYNRYSTVEDYAKLNGVSPAHEFARVMTDANENIAVGIVSNAIGGTTIQKWQKGSPYGYYEQAVARAREAMETGTLKGIIWHQGEQNAVAGTYSDYPALLAQLISDLRADLGIANLPVVIGKLNENQTNVGTVLDVSGFNSMLETTAAGISNCGIVSADGATLNSDVTHYDAPAQRMLGARYGIKMCELINGSYGKYYYPYEFRTSTSAGVTTTKCSVINTTDTAKDVRFIIAGYDSQGRLAAVHDYTQNASAELGKQSFEDEFALNNAYSYRAYLWENDSLYPIYNQTVTSD